MTTEDHFISAGKIHYRDLGDRHVRLLAMTACDHCNYPLAILEYEVWTERCDWSEESGLPVAYSRFYLHRRRAEIVKILSERVTIQGANCVLEP